MARTQSQRKRGVGRPNKRDDRPDEFRGKQTSQRWTMAEYIELREKAAAAGLTVTEYIRRAAKGQPIVEAPPSPPRGSGAAGDPGLDAKLDRLIYEVNAVGVNLMQHLRDDRFGRGHRTQADWDELYQNLQRVLDALTRELS
jgi:hypothetical protein